MYYYKVKGENKLHAYSGRFNTKKEAISWYNKHGKALAREFNRELVLVNCLIEVKTI